MRAGIKVESESIGDGRIAERGHAVTIAYEIRLNRGDLVQSHDSYVFEIGAREVIAALEYGVEGMAEGGERVFRAGPHLAYRDTGIEGLVPPNAVLHFSVRLLSVSDSRG